MPRHALLGLINISDPTKPYSGETNHKAIMAQLNPACDIFDSVSWDPDLACLLPSPDKSPEPVAIKPQPVAYTTVGSVVNPRAAPQFSAPNRIQREGAQRKSLLSILQTYEANTINDQFRGPPPPLKMANSMQYAQQLGRNPPQPTNNLRTATDRISRFSLENFTDINNMSDDDLRVLIYSLGQRLNKENDAPLSSSVKVMAEEELAARFGSTSGPIQGLEKMQTVQRLSKFPNPMQKVAQNKLSEFSVAKVQQPTNKTIAVPNIRGLSIVDKKVSSLSVTSKPVSHLARPKPGTRLGDVATVKVTQNIEAAGGIAAYLAPYHGALPDPRTANLESRQKFQGELDRAYQFPAPGVPSVAQTNPLYGACWSNRLSTSIPTRQTGYPPPLTAGPPGQRQYPAAASFAPLTAGTEEFWPLELAANSYNPLLNEPSYHPSTNSQSSTSFTTAGQKFPSLPEIISRPGFDLNTPKQVTDTISPQEAFKYYPNGFPADMTGYWASASEENLRKLGELPLLTTEERETKELEAIDERFYHGYRRMVSMKCEDYEAEYNANQISPYGPIARPPKVELQRRSVQEWNNMTEVEEATAMRPLLNAAYGTLVEYVNRMPGGRYSLSQWRKAEEELFDRSKDGNKSYFGEDWGAPPKDSSANVAPQPAREITRAQNDTPDLSSASQILAAKHMQQL